MSTMLVLLVLLVFFAPSDILNALKVWGRQLPCTIQVMIVAIAMGFVHLFGRLQR